MVGWWTALWWWMSIFLCHFPPLKQGCQMLLSISMALPISTSPFHNMPFPIIHHHCQLLQTLPLNHLSLYSIAILNYMCLPTTTQGTILIKVTCTNGLQGVIHITSILHKHMPFFVFTNNNFLCNHEIVSYQYLTTFTFNFGVFGRQLVNSRRWITNYIR